MAVDCIVCGLCKPPSITHLGLDTCRACAVFYKRYRHKPGKLKCLHAAACYSNIGKTLNWCRKCRFERFEMLLRAASEEVTFTASEDTLAPIPIRKHFEIERRKAQINGMVPRASIKTIGNFERIRANFHRLSVRRLTAELELRGILVNKTVVNRDDYELAPCTYRTMNEGTKILIDGLFEFIHATFPEFRFLKNAEKWVLIRNYEKGFLSMDSELRMKRRFGMESHWCVFASYSTYMSPDSLDRFFIDCPYRGPRTSKNLVEAANAARACYDKSIKRGKELIRTIDPPEDEFFALMGLSFWSVETFDASDKLLSLATRYRTQIINELFAHYRSTIGVERGASRVGSLLCLLQALRRLEMSLQSYFEIFRLLGAFDEDTLTYQLQIAMLHPNQDQ